MGKPAQWTTVEPHGTPRNAQKGRLRHQIHLFLRVSPIFLFAFPPLLRPLPIPIVSVVSKRLPFVRRAALGIEETG